MKRGIILIISLLMAFSVVKSQVSRLEGDWKLNKVSVIKIENRDSIKMDTRSFDKNVVFGVFDRLVFKNNTLELYADNMVRSIIGEPRLSADKLTIDYSVRPYHYDYKLVSDKLYIKELYDPFQDNMSYYSIDLEYIKNEGK